MTGAASGIGAATAARLRDEGATVVGVATSPTGVRRHRRGRRSTALLRRHRAAGSTASCTPPASPAAAPCTCSTWPSGTGSSTSTSPARSSSRGHALRRMVDQDADADGERGSIVTLASVEGLEGTAGGSAYNASKGGVVLLTKNVAIDYGAPRHPGQRHLPGLHRHADDAGASSACPGMEDVHRRRSSASTSSAASAQPDGDRRRRRLPAVAPTPRSSPARPSPSTAATPPAATTASPRCSACARVMDDDDRRLLRHLGYGRVPDLEPTTAGARPAAEVLDRLPRAARRRRRRPRARRRHRPAPGRRLRRRRAP